jgi:hypothetical protein
MGSNEAISRSEFNALVFSCHHKFFDYVFKHAIFCQELVDLRQFFDSVDTNNLDQVSFSGLLTQLDKLKVRYDPSLLASAFAQIQAENDSKTIDFAGEIRLCGVLGSSLFETGFLDLLFLARQSTGGNLEKDLIQMGHSTVINGGV